MPEKEAYFYSLLFIPSVAQKAKVTGTIVPILKYHDHTKKTWEIDDWFSMDY